MEGDQDQEHGQSAAAPVPTAVPLGGADRGGKAQRPLERVAEPTGGQKIAWRPCGLQGPSSDAASVHAGLPGQPLLVV